VTGHDSKGDDATLLGRWRDGDRAAGDALFERHFDAVYGFFARKTAADPRELVQRTFAALVEGRDRYRGDATVRTYLFAIARHELYRHYREQRRDQALRFDVTSLHDLEPTPSARLAQRRASRLLLEALRRIPLDLQIAVELHYWEGLTGPELAQVLEIPEGTVRSRLRRALEQLRVEVERLGTGGDLLTSTLTDLDRWAAGLRELGGA